MSTTCLFYNQHTALAVYDSIILNLEPTDRPVLRSIGSQYDFLKFDEIDGVVLSGGCNVTTGGIDVRLTEQDIEDVRTFLQQKYDEEKYSVYLFDKNRRFLHVARKYTVTDPEMSVIPLTIRTTKVPSETDIIIPGTDTFDRAYLAIDADGTYSILPGVLKESHKVLCTEEEFLENWDIPEHQCKYDFASSAWIDIRSLESYMNELSLEIRTHFEGVRWKAWNKYVPQYDQATWASQLTEATAWLKDNTEETPYIDLFLAGRDTPPTKEELCLDIVSNNHQFKLVMAPINSEQWNWLDKIKVAKTNSELDTIRTQFRNSVK